MALDLIDEGKIKSGIIDPTLDRVEKETIPQLGKTTQDAENNIATQLSNIVAGTLQAIQASFDKLVSDANHLLDRANGAELTIGPIVVPEFTIKLRVPPAEEK